jgi:hypothetical protein
MIIDNINVPEEEINALKEIESLLDKGFNSDE